MLADAEVFVRCQGIFDHSLFDRKLQDAAEFIGVSRQAVYMWFLGKSLPHPSMRETLQKLIADLKAKQ
jgi:hypothetical protein